MALADDLSSIQLILTRYILPICLAFGIIGSLLNITVFSQKHLRSNSCSVYFISTSIFNFLVMLFGIFPVVLASYSSYDYASYSVPYCKFRSYIIHALLMMSRSSVALACIDRFALCSRNNYTRTLSQRHIAIRLVVVAFFLWLVIPIHMLVEINIQMPGKKCGNAGVYSTIYSVYAAIVTAIPILIMLIFSTLAIRNLRNVRSRVQPNVSLDSSNVNTTVRLKKRDVQFIIILFSEVIIYFVSTITFPVYLIYILITGTISKTSDRMAIEGFVRYLALSFLIYINSCSIFYVHLLASKAFRQEFKQVILCLFKRQQQNNRLFITTEMSTMRKNLNRKIEKCQTEVFPKNN